MIIITIAIVLGFWYGLQLALNTQYPALTVASGSMCTLPGPECDGWTHPFERTLHVGDLIIVQGVNPADIKAAPYPDGDIIVFRKPGSTDERIVHRAVDSEIHEGKIYFKTKGDGNGSPDYHYGEGTWDGMISQDLVIGKVVLRIPWVGHISLFMRDSLGFFLIVALIILILIIEFSVPPSKSEETRLIEEEERKESSET